MGTLNVIKKQIVRNREYAHKFEIISLIFESTQNYSDDVLCCSEIEITAFPRISHFQFGYANKRSDMMKLQTSNGF